MRTTSIETWLLEEKGLFLHKEVCGLGKQCRDLKERNQFTLKFFSVRKRYQSSMDEYDCGEEDGLKALLTFAIPDVLGTQTRVQSPGLSSEPKAEITNQ